MKFCYVDESGQGAENLIMVGVVVDAQRMKPTKSYWDGLINQWNRDSGGRIQELKTGQLYRGNDSWRQWDGGDRNKLIEGVIDWMVERKHAVTFGAVSKLALDGARPAYDLGGLENSSQWSIAALHLILGIQKQYQGNKGNKGNTVFVFDDASKGDELVRLVKKPPHVTDGFYSRNRKQSQLDQVIDIPYFADSEHVGLIQAADLFAFILRLYADLKGDPLTQKYDGEFERVQGWIGQLKPLLLADSMRWPQNSSDPCVSFLRAIAPPPLLRLAA